MMMTAAAAHPIPMYIPVLLLPLLFELPELVGVAPALVLVTIGSVGLLELTVPLWQSAV
ncbi:hypothetical protein EDD21DRAFT_370895 [Dissophora ornata]|nr:hypothetical protein EDD21DRAFT_370895 [Dissophora ornata]